MANNTATHSSISAALESDIHRVFESQRLHQYQVARSTGKERIRTLQKFQSCLLEYQKEIEAALWADFRKSPTEVTISELGVILGEIRHTIGQLRHWMAPKAVRTPISIFGSSSEIRYEPKGVCLIISPWNFPFNLTFGPLVGAIAAGNCVILKPSEYTPHSSAVMKKIVEKCFAPEEVCLFEGDATVSQALLQLPFHHIFFTGSPAVGKIVMAAAAKNLSSVTLELGGKSPVIVDQTANLDTAAAKIAWIKSMNAGQICIAPDYLLVHESVKDQLIAKIGEKTAAFYGKDAAQRIQSPDLCRMVNDNHYQRVSALLEDAVDKGATINFGGTTDATQRYIETTILSDIPDNATIWSEEIFGPLLPVRTWSQAEEVVQYVNGGEKPLAMYVFSNSVKKTNYFLNEIRAGGATVNDCGAHFYNANLPFGGSNNSGIGSAHGHFSFLAFSHAKSVLRQTKFLPTTNLMLPPYGGRLAKFLLKGILKWF